MDKEKVKSDLILPHLKPGEELIGFFQATYTSPFLLLLSGPLMFLAMRLYYVAVTNHGLHLHKLNLWWKPDTYNFFPYTEISNIKLGKGFMRAPLKLIFANGRKLTIAAQLKGVDKVAKLDDKTKEYLLSKSA